MPKEIERKFLVDKRDVDDAEPWRADVRATLRIVQFYIVAEKDRSIRLRIVDERAAKLTIKIGQGISRDEFEYDVPLDDARELMDARIGDVVEKERHLVPHGHHTIEIDVYSGALAGLVVAEIELEGEDDAVDLPAFIGREVTGDPRFLNQRLALDGLPDDMRGADRSSSNP